MSTLEGYYVLRMLALKEKVKSDILDLISLDGDDFTDGEVIDYIKEYLTVEESNWSASLKSLIANFNN